MLVGLRLKARVAGDVTVKVEAGAGGKGRGAYWLTCARRGLASAQATASLSVVQMLCAAGGSGTEM